MHTNIKFKQQKKLKTKKELKINIFAHMLNVKQKVLNKQNKTNKNKLIGTDNIIVSTREGGGGRTNWVKGVKYMVMEGK